MATRHDAGFWLLIFAGGVTLFLLSATALVILWRMTETLPGWNHLVLLAILALLLGVVVRAVVRARQPE
jgi:hypothetical protein